jgi:hypothetical protein
MAPLSQGESHRYCITASGGPLSITLVWYDYPGSPAAGGSMLVNDLDLGGWALSDYIHAAPAWHVCVYHCTPAAAGGSLPV